MRKITAALAATALLALGIVAIATSASAHTATLTGEASCADASGNFTITWTLSGDTAGKTMTASSVTGSGLDIVDGSISPNIFTDSYDGDATVKETTNHNLSVGTAITAEGTITWTKPRTRDVERDVSVTVALPKGCEVPVEPAVYTAPTCDAIGTLIGAENANYTWVESGFPDEATLTAEPVGPIQLTGQTVFGPYDLTQLTGEQCESDESDPESDEPDPTPETPAPPANPVTVQPSFTG
jgi:hypothetical protein